MLINVKIKRLNNVNRNYLNFFIVIPLESHAQVFETLLSYEEDKIMKH